MSEDSWEKYLEPGPGFQLDDSTFRLHDNRSGSWQAQGDTLEQNYNGVRESEKQKRNDEIFQKVKHFYCSRNGVVTLAISVVLCLITTTIGPEGLFFWNIVLFMIVWGFYEMTARSQVRAEWEEVREEFDTL